MIRSIVIKPLKQSYTKISIKLNNIKINKFSQNNKSNENNNVKPTNKSSFSLLRISLTLTALIGVSYAGLYYSIENIPIVNDQLKKILPSDIYNNIIRLNSLINKYLVNSSKQQVKQVTTANIPSVPEVEPITKQETIINNSIIEELNNESDNSINELNDFNIFESNETITISDEPTIDSHNTIIESPEVQESEVNESLSIESISLPDSDDISIPSNDDTTHQTTDPIVTISHTVTLPEVSSETLAHSNKHENTTNAIDSISAYSKAIQKELEDTVLKDIDTIDNKTLRIRYIQLAIEYFERMKWENLRLQQVLKQVESEVTNKYLDLMIKQRQELETSSNEVISNKINELNKEKEYYENKLKEENEINLKNVENSLQEEYSKKLSEELTKQANKIENELNDELNYQIAVLREGHVKKQLELQKQLEELRSELVGYDDSIRSVELNKTISVNLHKQSARITALELAVEQAQSIQPIVNEIKQSDFSELSQLAVDKIPSVVLEQGVPTYSQIKSRFLVARNEARKAALAPEGLPPLLGQLFGNLLATISYTPKGNIKGNGIEETLSRVNYYIDRNELKNALIEAEKIDGLAKVLLIDWIELVRNKLIIDQTLKVLKAESLLAHSSVKVL